MLKKIKNLCLMQNIFLMVLKIIKIMQYLVLNLHMIMEQDGLFLCDTNGGTLPDEVEKL